jgi:16S rRNA (adenine1518-N6/adenine1519-N6)-dimethyltransferase
VTRPEIRALLARRGLRPSRERGQNFLVDDALADRLAAEAGVEAGQGVLEVGTGLGILTRALVRRGARVTSVEVDAGLVRALREEALLPEGVELLHADALALDLRARLAALPGPVHVVANLPYSAATPLLRRLLDLRDVLADWSVMVQRELARRIEAHPGERDYGSLAVLHRLTVETRRALDLRPGCFFPAPRVVSRFLRIVPRREPLLRPGELERVERLVRAAFGTRRKTLRAALRAGGLDEAALAAVAAAGLDLDARAEQLAPERFLAAARALA